MITLIIIRCDSCKKRAFRKSLCRKALRIRCLCQTASARRAIGAGERMVHVPPCRRTITARFVGACALIAGRTLLRRCAMADGPDRTVVAGDVGKSLAVDLAIEVPAMQGGGSLSGCCRVAIASACRY